MEDPPVVPGWPTPANPFNSVLRSIELSQVKRASQTDAVRSRLLANVCQPPVAPPQDRSEKAFSSDYLSSKIISPGLACELLEFVGIVRMHQRPP